MQLSHLDYSTVLPNTETYIIRGSRDTAVRYATAGLVATIFCSFVSRAVERRDIITDLTAIEVEFNR